MIATGALALLAIVAVERAPDCPDAESLVADLDLELGAPGAALGIDGDHRLRVDAPAGDLLRIELTDRDGRPQLVREVVVAGASCEARARTVAVVVGRWLSALPAPAAPASRTRASASPVRVSERRARVDARAGAVIATDVGPTDTHAALGIGAALRLFDFMVVAADVALQLPTSTALSGGRASIIRGSARLRAELGREIGRFRLGAGPAVRLCWADVSVSGLPGATTSTSALPGLGLAVAGSLRVAPRLWLALVVEPWLALGSRRLYVVEDGGRQDVYRTPAGGLQVDLAAAVDLF